MRSRIIRALRAADASPAGADPLALAALTRAQAQGWDLLAHPARLRITTIDALALSIAQSAPMVSGIGAGTRILTDPTPEYRDAVRLLLRDLEQRARWSEALQRVLDGFDNNVPRLEDLLIAMLARRDQWLRLLRHPELRATVTGNIELVAARALAEVAGRIPAGSVPALLELARYASANLRADGVDSPVLALDGIQALPPASRAGLAAWRGLAGLLLTDKGEFRRKVDRRAGFPPGKDAQQAKQRFADLVEELGRIDALAFLLNETRRLPAPEIDDAQWRILEDLLEVLIGAVSYLELLFGARGTADFIRIALAAERALGEPEQPSELALILDYRIAHLLVDEFQDTSYTQYELIGRLTAGWQSDDGRTLFLVGDPLQSIYRFREAEVHLFERTMAQARFAGVPLQCLRLRANFRSQPRVLDWLNDSFPRLDVAPTPPGVTQVPYSPAVASASLPAEPAFHAELRALADQGGDHEIIAAWIAQQRARHPDRSVAVLARSRRHLAGLAAALRGLGVAFQAEDVATLDERPALRDLLALTRALLHPADRTAWLAVLRAPWCGLSLRDLARLIEPAAGRLPADLLTGAHDLARLSDDGRARLARVGPVLAQALADRGTSLAALVERCWLQLGGPACLTGATEFAQARAYLAMLAALEPQRRRLSPARLAAEVDRLGATASGEGHAAAEVVLTTIHKAKGLEFDTVILPATERQTRGDPHQLLVWTELVLPAAGPTLLFAALPPAAAFAAEATLYAFVRRHEQLESEAELRRLLYVALTRARRSIQVFGRIEHDPDGVPLPPRRDTLLRLLWPIVAGDAPGPAPALAAGIAAPPPRMLARLPEGWRNPLAPAIAPCAPAMPAADIEFAWASLPAKFTGTVVHEWLQRITAEGIEAWPAARLAAQRDRILRRLRSLGLHDAAGEEACAKVLTALAQTLADPRGAWVLSGAHQEAAAEFRLSGYLAGELLTVAMDRTFVDADGVRWIIDYKTSTHSGGGLTEFLDSEQARYAGQLARYGALMRERESRPIMLGLYFPLLSAFRSWPLPAATAAE
jgi:ATP-dependent exoDNAse (exonuclease V) beta subunit